MALFRNYWSSINALYLFVNCIYQQNSRVLYTFVPNKSFVQLLDISPQNFIFFKTFDSEFSDIEKWFADQNFNLLEDFNPVEENKYLVTSLIKQGVKNKKMTRYSIQPRDRIFVKGYGYLSFAKTMGKNIGKNVSSKYSQKILDHAKQSATDALKVASKREIQKAAEATSDLNENKIAYKAQKPLEKIIRNEWRRST